MTMPPSLLAQIAASEVQLTAAGWFMMIVSITLVIGLLTFCLSRLLRHPPDDTSAP